MHEPAVVVSGVRCCVNTLASYECLQIFHLHKILLAFRATMIHLQNLVLVLPLKKCGSGAIEHCSKDLCLHIRCQTGQPDQWIDRVRERERGRVCLYIKFAIKKEQCSVHSNAATTTQSGWRPTTVSLQWGFFKIYFHLIFCNILLKVKKNMYI